MNNFISYEDLFEEELKELQESTQTSDRKMKMIIDSVNELAKENSVLVENPISWLELIERVCYSAGEYESGFGFKKYNSVEKSMEFASDPIIRDLNTILVDDYGDESFPDSEIDSKYHTTGRKL